MFTSKELWILVSDEKEKSFYRSFLELRYKMRFFYNLAGLEEALLSNCKRPDAMLSDIQVQESSFFGSLSSQALERAKDLNIIFVSNESDIDTIRHSLIFGAKDYLTKPLTKNELVVKLERILKVEEDTLERNKANKKYQEFQHVFDHLTLKETKILQMFIKASPQSVTKDEIYNRIWKDSIVHKKTLDVHIYNLRRKLKPFKLNIDSNVRGKWILKESA